MKRFKGWLLCALLICALAVPVCTAEDEAVSEPTPQTTAETTAAPTGEITPEPTSETTPVPTSETTPEPTSEATPEPTAEPSNEPTVEPTEEPTTEPTVEPTVTPEPTQLPEPGEIGDLLEVRPEGDAQQQEGVWYISLTKPDSALAFKWTVEGEAQRYLIYTEDSQGELKFVSQSTQMRIELNAADYISGRYTLYVGAVFADGSVSWGCARFEIRQGGLPGGGFPGSGFAGFGGGGFGGSFGSMGGLEQGQQGFHITPGKALTGKHASGTKNTDAYTCSPVEASEEAVWQLYLESTQSRIVLDAGESSFFVSTDDGHLILTPETNGESWSFSALAIKTLLNSGYNSVAFYLDGESLTLPTALEFSGEAYALLRSQGYVLKDMGIEISADGICVSVAGTNYSINESGELTPLEG